MISRMPHASLAAWNASFKHHNDPATKMRLLSAIAFLTLSAVAFAADAAPLAAPHQVDIPCGNAILHAQLYKPDGDGPFPIVIALHGCGGLAGHSEPVLPRYRDWAEQLLKDGKAVLLPDSYGSRELGPQCRVKERKVRARRERVDGHHGVPAMAGAAALGGARPHQPDRMGQRRQRAAVGGASAIVVARRRAGLPLGDRVLSGLPDLGGPRLERAGADAAV